MSAIYYVTLIILLGFEASAKKKPATPVFRFHLMLEPRTLDPAQLRGTGSVYFFSNLYRGLYFYDGKTNQLVTEGAQQCTFSQNNTKLSCTLATSHRWSDNQPVTAQEYVVAFRRLMSNKSKSTRKELLMNLKNAPQVIAGKVPPKKLGVHAKSRQQLVFNFNEPDADFLYKLASPILVPVRVSQVQELDTPSPVSITNGPYKIKRWQKNKKVELISNKSYPAKGFERPPVEVLFIDDDTAALNLYLQGTLSFLRRLPTYDIPKYKSRADFHQFPLARFDYIGFSGKLKDDLALRKALVQSLRYRELQKIYHSPGKPGCVGLPSHYFLKRLCHDFDQKQASKQWSKASPHKDKTWSLVFSDLGGEDVKRGMEWIQNQWKKHLGFNVHLEAREQKAFLHELRWNTPEIFRKGVGLDRPTCLAALENFSIPSSENYIGFSDNSFKRKLSLYQQATNKTKKKALCQEAIEVLMKSYLLIPLGPMHLTVLARPQFSGWYINDLNQLDLSRLRWKPQESQ